MSPFDSLPVELVAQIVAELDVQSVIVASSISRRLRAVCTDVSLNPWRKPILAALHGDSHDALRHLCVYSSVPRQNFVEILSRAPTAVILFSIVIPKLSDAEWREAAMLRFLPGFLAKWRRPGVPWREVFMRAMFLVQHRLTAVCHANDAWTKYFVIGKRDSANLLEVSSRNFNPFTIFDNVKCQSGLAHLETHIRVVCNLGDMRILALGMLSAPGQETIYRNRNAAALLHPPGVSKAHDGPYSTLQFPRPRDTHARYPNYTPGGRDTRWREEEGDLRYWIGALMLTAQLVEISADADEAVEGGRSQYVSLGWEDLWTLFPWMAELIVRRIDGPGLGLDDDDDE
ncbi:hypothetical protein AURDEDRAFT_80661 [Auricularia subglabra TFB-10046 SS5]|nr:hypothetical protein AURDEDRAFT_80661 [Auricularia subglabra TFB-10046 SS5]